VITKMPPFSLHPNFRVMTMRNGKLADVFQPPKRRKRRQNAVRKAKWNAVMRGRRSIKIVPKAATFDALLDWIATNNAPVRVGLNQASTSELAGYSFMANMGADMSPWEIAFPANDDTHMWLKMRFS
jgi:hypothetical protein